MGERHAILLSAAAAMLALAVSGCATVLSPAALAETIAVTDKALLSALDHGSGRVEVKQTTSIPYVVGSSCYNWLIHFRPVAREITLDEELILPAPAPTWGVGPEGRTTVNPQRSAAVTTRSFDGRSGVARSGWCVAEGDPVGRYQYVIRQGGVEIARFLFTVGDLI